MHEADQLRIGMSLDEVRTLLRGWHEELPSAVLSPDRTHLFYTITFTPPRDRQSFTLRLTFDNGRLFIWGEPADPHGRNPAEAC